MIWIIAALTAAALCCAVGWYLTWQYGRYLLWYMNKKGCPAPTDEELKRDAEIIGADISRKIISGRRR